MSQRRHDWRVAPGASARNVIEAWGEFQGDPRKATALGKFLATFHLAISRVISISNEILQRAHDESL
jgi:hypothetical protein